MDIYDEKYLKDLLEQLLQKSMRKKVILTPQWAKLAPSEAGVYAFFDGGHLAYGGETGNIRGRMNDILSSQHHTFRRNFGEKYFSATDGYVKANAHNKFPDHIEEMLKSRIQEKVEVAYLPVKLGRKELEELIHEHVDVEHMLFKRSKRKN